MGFENPSDGIAIWTTVFSVIFIAVIAEIRRLETIKQNKARAALKERRPKSQKPNKPRIAQYKVPVRQPAEVAGIVIEKSSDQEDESDSMRNALAQRRMESRLKKLKIYLKPDGTPLDADQDLDLWLSIRRSSVSATDARKLVKLNGQVSLQRSRLLKDKAHGLDSLYTSAFDQGIAREPHIATWVKQNFPGFGFQHNRNLYVGENSRHVATPDMISGEGLCEIKVSTRNAQTLKSVYRDQLQWQLHVTGLHRVLLVVEHRETYIKEWIWVDRDQKRIDQLAAAADAFIFELDLQLATPLEKNTYFESEDRLSIDLSVPSRSLVKNPFISPPPHREPDLIYYLDDEAELTDEDYESIIRCYINGAEVSSIAYEINATQAVVVTALSRMIFGLSGNLVDEAAPRFGQGWSSADLETFQKLYSQGRPVPEIAKELGRDQLGLCFRIFMYVRPAIPRKFAGD